MCALHSRYQLGAGAPWRSWRCAAGALPSQLLLDVVSALAGVPTQATAIQRSVQGAKSALVKLMTRAPPVTVPLTGLPE